MQTFRMRFSVAVLTVLFLATTASLLAAQENDEGNIFAISFWKIEFDKIDEVLENWEEHFAPLQKEIPEIKSVRVFRHFWGPDWNLLLVTEYENLTAMEAADEKMQELFKKQVPEESRRDEIMSVTGSHALGHWDAIVTEIPKLGK